MILYICTGQEVKCIFEIYLPVREHTWLIGSGGCAKNEKIELTENNESFIYILFELYMQV